MQYAVFDVETTGLGIKDEVIQFSCILTDENFCALNYFNFYCYTQQELDVKASEITGINREDLWRLSEGKTFEDQFFKLKELVNNPNLVWVHYSTNGFDLRLVNQTLTNNGLDTFYFGKNCTRLDKQSGVWNFNICNALANFKYGGRPRRLSQAASELPYSEEEIIRVLESKCKGCGVNGYHNALYDAFVTWLLLYQNKDVFRY